MPVIYQYISYTKYLKLFFKASDQEKIFFWLHGWERYNEKKTNVDIWEEGSKIWLFRGGVIFEWPLINSAIILV